MSPQMVRILIAGALFVHGIGHTLGFWKPARSLPFIEIPEPTLNLAGNITWVVVAVGFIASSLSFYGVLIPANWWRPLAVVFAVVSLVGILLFGRSWPLFNFMAACAFNIVVLVALLWFRLPPVEMFGN